MNLKKSEYTTFRILKFKEPFYRTIKSSFKKEFNLKKFTLEENNENIFDKKIKLLSLKNKLSVDLLILLRCKISHQIYKTINRYYKKGIDCNLDWDKLEMLRIFLEDNGERFVSSKVKTSLEKPFDLFYLEEIHNKNLKIKEPIYPFSGEIIFSYDHLRTANISTWTNIRITGDNRLKKLLHPHGKLLLISPWALLKYVPTSTIVLAWKKFGKIKISFNKLKSLIESYKSIYPKKNKRNWNPDQNFLLNLNPPQKDDELLLAIDECVRSYKWIEFQKELPKNKNEIDENDNRTLMESLPNKKNDPYLQSGFQKAIIKQVREEAKKLAREIVLEIIKTADKHPDRIKALILFSKIDLESPYKNNEFENLAKECGHLDSWLTKLLKLPLITSKTIKVVIKKLQLMTIESITNPKLFVMKYEGNDMVNLYQDEISLFNSFYKGTDNLRWGGSEHKTIFEEENYIQEFTLFFIDYMNPKKSRKEFFIKIFKEVLEEKSIKEQIKKWITINK